jgi:hypothetical protein
MFWTQSSTRTDVDIGVLEESALAMAQATIQNVMDESGVSKAELARRMECDRSFVTRMLTGSHNLTVKTMAKSLAVCGFEVRFQPVPIAWNWVNPPVPIEEEVPANAGTTMFIRQRVAIVVPALEIKERV